MMFAPSKSEEKSRELAGNIMVRKSHNDSTTTLNNSYSMKAMFLVVGLTSGSLIGVLLKFILFPS